MKENKKLLAFTLAEVLITLAIIGVVAALTIPTVVTNYRDKELETRHLKAKSVVANAMTYAISKSGATDLLSTSVMSCHDKTGTAKVTCLKDASNELFKIIKDSASDTSFLTKLQSKTYIATSDSGYNGFSLLPAAYAAGAPSGDDVYGAYCGGYGWIDFTDAMEHGCEAENVDCTNAKCEDDKAAYLAALNNISVDKPWDNVSYAFLTGDGITMGYGPAVKSDNRNIGLNMVVDVNGDKLPNKLNKDLFIFSINSRGTVREEHTD